jgi:hypothetical protein
MKEDKLVSFEIAKLAYEKGYVNGSYNHYIHYLTEYIYDEDPNHPESYKKDEVRCDSRTFHINHHGNSENWTIYEAPTQSLLQQWLREEKVINVYAKPYDIVTKWIAIITNHKATPQNPSYLCYEYCDTYEDAIEFALFEALKLIEI